MISAIHTATSGMRDAEILMASTANNVANVNTADFQQTPRPQAAPAISPGAGNNVDVAEQMVAMTLANATMKANVVSVRTATEMYDSILKLRPS